ncbi:MAG: phenylalanine--tRNA ligase subunit beta [Candidatus Pacearchaeota archaeon]
MANIKFDRKKFERDFGKVNDSLIHKIEMFGTPFEGIDDNEIEIEVAPNRPDLLSYQGFRRSFSAFLDKRRGVKTYKVNKPLKNYEVSVDKSVEDVRPWTSCAVVKNLKLDDQRVKEIVDMQEKLHATLGRNRKRVAIGIYPLEKIKLPIKYKALEPDKINFKPLESKREMSGLEILQKHSTGKEYAHLLSGKTKFPVFTDAEGKFLSMPPIINSHEIGKVETSTTDVFIECSGSDEKIADQCLNIVVSNLAEMDGEIYSMKLKGPKKTTPLFEKENMNVSIENAKRILGLDLDEKGMKNYLERMGHDYSKGKVEIAPWRVDVLSESDLIEDVAIGYGYDKIVPEDLEVYGIGQEDPRQVVKRKISEILSGLEMLEISNYHLTNNKEQFTNMGVSEKQAKASSSNAVNLKVSKTEHNIMRKDLSHFALKIMAENIDAEYPQKIYETGKVFSEDSSGISEQENLSAAISPGDFTEIKQILEYLFGMLGIEVKVEEPKENPSHLIAGRVADIKIDDKKIGQIGEVHPKILKNWKIKNPVSLFEISLEEVYGVLG